jgi:hypothetical protein
MGVNKGRVWLGGLVGGVVWSAWSYFIGTRLAPHYQAAINAGLFLKAPRYSYFTGVWIAMVFVLSILLAHLYVWVRPTLGPGLMTAFKVGAIAGFFAGFPANFGQAAWSSVPRVLPLGWLLDLLGGAILATVAAGWLYKE